MRHHVEESHLSLLMVIFPIVVVIFFTTLMKGGVPTDMPVGIVDQDNSATSRQLVHKLDAFHTTKVVAHYWNMAEARHAIQKNEIYAFLLDLTEHRYFTAYRSSLRFHSITAAYRWQPAPCSSAI